jgi:RecB family exonuclease
MSPQDVRVAASALPRVSPSRLEAWDRCPTAYRFEYVLRLPQPVGDQQPRLLGSVAHRLLEDYLQETLRTGARPPLPRVAATAAGLLEDGGIPDASGDLIREAAELVSRWLAQWAVPVESVVAVERALAVDRHGTHVEWDASAAFVRGRLDLVTVAGPHATILDWKSGWVSEDEDGLRVAWAPGLYAALLWAFAPRLEQVSVEYHYLRTNRTVRVALSRTDSIETLAWARALATRIAAGLAAPEDPESFPPRPSTACGTCPWVNRCSAGQTALEAMAEGPIPDDAEARRLTGLLLAGEARVTRLRERLKEYLQDRLPLRLDGLELGFFLTKGRYDVQAVSRAATAAGIDPLTLLSPDGRALAAFLKARPAVERTLAAAWTPTPPWFGHRKSQARTPNPATSRKSSSLSSESTDDRHNVDSAVGRA